MEAVIAMSAYYFVLNNGAWEWGKHLDVHSSLYLQATTACFSAIIIAQIVNVFLCKTPNHSLFRSPLFDNRIILWGIALEITLIGLIDYTPWGNLIFGTVPLEPKVWLFIAPFVLTMIVLEEVRKFIVLKKQVSSKKVSDRS
jgi:magnesium-transporting ATPase (P-type)